MLFISILVLICFVSTSGLSAQTDVFDSVFFDMSEFPQWARDLRRGNIIAFGIFPFAYLIATFGYDTYRFANNNWDRRYAPWPFNSAGSVSMTQNEMFTVLGATAGTAVLFALVDHTIVRIRRNRLEREIMRIPEGTPVIIRRPLYEEETDTPDLDVPENNNP
jgi:hypothetical protein